MNVLGSRIKQLREKNDLSQKQVAKSLGISNVQLSRYESGDRRPDPEMIKQIADYFDVSTDYLLGRNNNPSTCKNSEETTKQFPDLTDIDPDLLHRFIETVKSDPYQTLFFDNVLNSSKEERERLVRDLLEIRKKHKDSQNKKN